MTRRAVYSWLVGSRRRCTPCLTCTSHVTETQRQRGSDVSEQRATIVYCRRRLPVCVCRSLSAKRSSPCEINRRFTKAQMLLETA